MHIHSRRYLGNKASIAGWIRDEVRRVWPEFRSVCDLFAGTGSVAWAFNDGATDVVANDILYSNYVCLQAFLSSEPLRVRRLQQAVQAWNAARPMQDNYVSEHFGNRYWSPEVARHIGFVRQAIAEWEGPPAEQHVLLCSLIYAADRVANTCGHYDAYRRSPPERDGLVLRLPDLERRRNRGNRLYCEDGGRLVETLQTDVLYLDPPYNSRQYSDMYHVLENIARWEQPPVHGVARKMDRAGLKSRYCTRAAPEAFSALIQKARCGLIVMSYNNMGDKGDPRSQACLSDEHIVQALASRGEVIRVERDYQPFSAGRSHIADHRERLFLCRVRIPAHYRLPEGCAPPGGN